MASVKYNTNYALVEHLINKSKTAFKENDNAQLLFNLHTAWQLLVNFWFRRVADNGRLSQ